MKLNILVALLISIFYISTSVYAQSDDISPLPPATEAPETSGESENSEKKETVFSKATDAQIKEAGNFYDSCTENETMSKLRDCKCAATAFIDKRIELGDKASVKEIIVANSDKCLKNEDNVTAYKKDDDFDTSEITEKDLEEADAVLLECKSDVKLNRSYDCECYAARFLDERIKQGPLIQKEILMQSFYNDCRNVVETTGYEYTQCMKMIMNMPEKGHEPKPFCECYARKWADLFENYKGAINMSSKKLMRLRARAACRWPDKGL